MIGRRRLSWSATGLAPDHERPGRDRHQPARFPGVMHSPLGTLAYRSSGSGQCAVNIERQNAFRTRPGRFVDSFDLTHHPSIRGN